MNDSDRDVLRTIIREELHAVLGELETARVRRSAALEELVQNDAAGMVCYDPASFPTICEEIAGAPGKFSVRLA